MAVIEAGFVPVKINRDYFPATCRSYGVQALPTQVIITPDGKLVDRMKGVVEAEAYVARLSQVAAAVRGQRGGVPAQVPAAAMPSTAQTPPRFAAGPVTPPAIPSQRVALADQPYAGQYNVKAAAPPIAQPPALPVENPPLGLEGYCPVQLIHDLQNNNPQWTLGDRRWGATHRGRTYLFAGPEQQRLFLDDPDRFAPLLSGNDIVLAIDARQNVAGKRAHGVLFSGRMYLFASEETLQRFSESPHRYANESIQAMRAVPVGSRNLR
jgi:YHS domain-containing protein